MKHATAKWFGILLFSTPLLFLVLAFGINFLVPEYRYTLLVTCLIMALYCDTLWVISIIHVIRNPLLAGRRARWVLCLLFFNFVSLPLYWYLHIWRPSIARAG